MRLTVKLLVLVALCGAVYAAEKQKTTAKPVVEHVEQDVEVIRKNLKDLVEQPSIHFMEYGPDGKDGYKYHLSAAENKEYIIHTTGPVSIPILETIMGTREERDKKLLKRLLESSKIKSLSSISSEPNKE
ncbi:uncharacterized protein LOC129772880 [Toxorhynchites rutilus septentrionalis]|uniref:uncharacterized protein LOC129772880 n=1 Tax=Toxorhynchites rutilus septentrionalis TaxID=329112 RepID=UPI00247A0AAF|nr:uncharacterized protein LOC129772880 [Toxorhynchites rutilus septentrionalis]